MKFEDMANWTEEQLKKEVVRLSEECEKKQHIMGGIYRWWTTLEWRYDGRW